MTRQRRPYMAVCLDYFCGFGDNAEAAFLYSELNAYTAKPSHSQVHNAIDDLFNLLGCVFRRFRRGVHGNLMTSVVSGQGRPANTPNSASLNLVPALT
jgi:hypothetical protein